VHLPRRRTDVNAYGGRRFRPEAPGFGRSRTTVAVSAGAATASQNALLRNAASTCDKDADLHAVARLGQENMPQLLFLPQTALCTYVAFRHYPSRSHASLPFHRPLSRPLVSRSMFDSMGIPPPPPPPSSSSSSSPPHTPPRADEILGWLVGEQNTHKQRARTERRPRPTSSSATAWTRTSAAPQVPRPCTSPATTGERPASSSCSACRDPCGAPWSFPPG